MARHTGLSTGVVRVAATAADLPRLPEALADFHGDHPGIQIGLRQGSATEIVALVAAGAVDVAVLALTEEPAGVEVHPLADEPLRVAVPVDDDLAGDARLAGRAARAAVHPRRARLGAARDRDGRRAGRGVQPAAAVRGRRPRDGALPRAGRAGHQPRARRAGSSGRGRSSARRICAIRHATGCHCSRPRRAGHRPAGSCRSACSSSDSRRLRGREPTSVWTGCAVAEEHEGRHRHDAVLSGGLLVVVDVELDDPEVVAALPRSRPGSGSWRDTAGTRRR